MVMSKSKTMREVLVRKQERITKQSASIRKLQDAEDDFFETKDLALETLCNTATTATERVLTGIYLTRKFLPFSYNGKEKRMKELRSELNKLQKAVENLEKYVLAESGEEND